MFLKNAQNRFAANLASLKIHFCSWHWLLHTFTKMVKIFAACGFWKLSIFLESIESFASFSVIARHCASGSMAMTKIFHKQYDAQSVGF